MDRSSRRRGDIPAVDREHRAGRALGEREVEERLRDLAALTSRPRRLARKYGLTATSLLPPAAAEAGLPFPRLLDRLLASALLRAGARGAR